MKRGEIKSKILGGMRAVLGEARTDRLLLKRNMRRYDSAGIIFIHIPKCAGTSVSRALYGGSLGHRSAQGLRSFDPATFDRLARFSVLRDPVARAYSAWRYCAEGGAKEGWAAPHPDYALPEFENFERFAIEWLPARNIETLDYVFRSQSGFIEGSDGTLLVEDLVTLPTLDAEWPRLSMLGNRESSALPILNSKGGEGGQKPEVSAQAQAALRMVYQRDFVLYERVQHNISTKRISR